MLGLPFWEYLSAYRSEYIVYTQQHALLTIQVVIVAALLGIGIAVVVYRSGRGSTFAISTMAVLFTIPSIALFSFLVPIFGLAIGAVFPPLVLYALLPIVRNGIVGLNEVDPNIVDAARGMGLGRWRILMRIELPLAWPVVLTGIRVATQLTLGIAAIAAFITDIGLGSPIFDALANFGAANTLNEAMAGTIGIVVLALLFDAVFVLVRRFTTPRGIRV